MLCMDVKVGYENVGVGKCVKRLREVGVNEYLVKWVSLFLREREVWVKVRSRLSGKGVRMKGGTIQGSPLSPILFMYIVGGVMDEVEKPPPSPLLRLTSHEDYTPLTAEEISRALSKSLKTCAAGPDHILYSVWKSVHRLKPSLLPSLLDLMLAHGFHHPSLKKALGIVVDKPGKPSYDSLSSFRVIVRLRTLSKILERVVTSRLSAQATTCSHIHPLQCGSLPGRSTADAALVL